jgi:hypothetical protein
VRMKLQVKREGGCGLQEIFEHQYYQLLENDSIICTETVKEVKASDEKMDKWAKEQGIDDETRDTAKTASALRLISSALGYDTSHWMEPNGALPHAVLESSLDAKLMQHTGHGLGECGCWAQSNVRCVAVQRQIQRITR